MLFFFRMEDKISNLKSFLYLTKTETYQRIGHRAIQIGHNILVFGGVNNQNQFMTSILRINSQTITVDLIQTKMALKLQDFSLFSYKEHIYLWGGNDQTGFSNKLYKFIGDDFELIIQNGQIPSPRSRQTSYFFMKKYLIIQGGMNNEDFFKDFYLFDCSNMYWNKINTNIDIPYSLNTYIFWNGGRGFLMLNESFDIRTKKINYENILYEFRFTDSKNHKVILEPINVTQTSIKPIQHKRQLTVLFVNFQSPYFMVIGGEIIPFNALQEEINETFSYKDIWIFNLQTLEWSSSNLKLLSASYGFQVIFFQERLYLIGGISLTTRDLSTTIEVVDINADCLEAKLCKVCREVYGFRQYSGYNKQFSIKFQHQENQRLFFTTKTISKFAKFIKHPFSAIGLLIDNIINLNGTLINIEFKYFDKSQPQPQTQQKSPSFLLSSNSLLQMIADNKPKMKYNYIKITDDTCGFTHNEIMQSLYSFGIKTQKLTTDKKYQQQLQIRKQYGVNIKLGSLRVAQSCLIVTKTLQDYIFICYFTTLQQKSTDKFQIISYYLSGSDRSSQINSQIIKENVSKSLPQDYQHLQDKIKTKIYLFNLQRQQMVKEIIDFNTYDVTYRQSNSMIFMHLRSYLESLYFNPYTGRIIKIQGTVLKFKNYLDIFKKDQQEKAITKLNLNLKQGFFKQYAFYRYNTAKYPIKEILVYHENRLLFTIETNTSNLCGFVIIPSNINMDLCKTKIQNHNEQHIFHKFIQKVISNYSQYLPVSSHFDTVRKLARN